LSRRKYSAFSRVVQLILLLALAVGVWIAVPHVLYFVDSRVTELKTHAVSRLEQSLGRHIAYQSISPSIVGSVDIHGLRIGPPLGASPASPAEAPEGEGPAEAWPAAEALPDEVLSVGRVRIFYRILPLLLSDLEDAVREILIENTTVSVDARRDAALLRMLGEAAGIDPDNLLGLELPPAHDGSLRRGPRLEDDSTRERDADGIVQQLASADSPGGIVGDRLKWVTRFFGGPRSDNLWGERVAGPRYPESPVIDPRLLEELPTISGRNITLELHEAEGSVFANDVDFDLRTDDEGMNFGFRGALRVDNARSGALGVVELDIRGNGQADRAMRGGVAELELVSFRSRLFDAEEHRFRMFASRGGFRVKSVEDDRPLDLVVGVGAAGIKAEFAADRYRVSDSVRMSAAPEGGIPENLRPWLGTLVSGEGSLSYSVRDGLRYDGDLTLWAPGEIGQFETVRARFSGDSERARMSQLVLELPRGRVLFAGTLDIPSGAPDGSLYLDRVGPRGYPPVTGRFDVEASDPGVRLSSDSFAYAGARFSVLTVEMGWQPANAETVALRIQGEEQSGGTVEATGTVPLQKEAPWGITATVDGVALDQIGRAIAALTPGQDDQVAGFLLGDSSAVSARARITGSRALPVLESAELAVDGAAKRSAELVVSRRKGPTAAQIEGPLEYSGYLEGRWSDVTFDSEFVAEYDRGGELTVQSASRFGDEQYDLRIAYAPGLGLVVHEPRGLNAQLATEAEGIHLRGRVEEFPLALPGMSGTANAAVEGRFFEADDWSVSVGSFDLTGLDGPGFAEASVSGAAEVVPWSLRFTQLEIQDRFSHLRGAGRIDLTPEKRRATGVLELAGVDSDERYSLEGEFRDEELAVSGSARQVGVVRFGWDAITGAVDLEGAVTLSDGAHSATIALRSHDVRFNNDQVSFDISAESTEERLSVTGGSVSHLGTQAEELGLELDLESGRITSAGSVTMRSPDEPREFTVRLDGRIGEGELRLEEIADADMSFRIAVDDLSITPNLPEHWEFSVQRTGERISLRGGPEESIEGELASDGAFTLRMRDPLPVSLQGEGYLQAGHLETNLSRIAVDVRDFRELFEDNEGFVPETGTIAGGMRIDGPLNDPNFYGTLQVNDALVSIPVLGHQIGPADTHVVFSEKELRLNRFTAPAGGGNTEIAGTVFFDRWSFDSYELTLRSVEDESVRVVSEFGPVAVDGRARGWLALDGSLTDLQLRGDITAAETEITLSEEPDRRDPPDDDFFAHIDLTVRSDRGVEFFWPTTGFPILRAVTTPGEELTIQGNTGTGEFHVFGDVGMQGGELFYFDRSFLVREGMIRFNEREQEFDPRVTVRAETRDVGPEGPIRLQLIADESPLSEMTVRLASEPSLPEEELLGILGANVISEFEDGPINLSTAVLVTSDLVSQFGVIRNIERSVRNALQLDLFTVRTQLFQQLVRGVIDAPAPGDPPDPTVPSLGHYLDNTTLFLGRSLSPELFLEFLVQVRARDPFAEDVRAFGGIEVDSELSLGLDTPFFDLEWSFSPRNPDDLFVPDNRLTFSWGFSY